jgi:uncharacterized protein YycO
MNLKWHIVKNFPKNYPLWKKILANTMFLFATTRYTKRKNNLQYKDLEKVEKIIKKGDIVLVGGLRRMSKFFIRGIFTHCLIHNEKDKMIHSIADGVEEVSLSEIFNEYDTLLVLRHREINEEKSEKVRNYVKSKIGKPFNFEFGKDENRFYCSYLAYLAYQQVELKTVNMNKNVIHPMQHINDRFEIVFASNNLSISENKIKIIK